MVNRTETVHNQEKPLSFTDRPLTFKYVDQVDLEAAERGFSSLKPFLRWLEHCRLQNGAAIIYIDTQDDYFHPDDDAGYHYALIGALDHYPPKEPAHYRQAIDRVIPLPLFTQALGLAEEDENLGRWLTADFSEIVSILRDAFEERVFLTSRSIWQKERFNRESDPTNSLRGSPQAHPGIIELLAYLNEYPDRIYDKEVLSLYAKARAIPVEDLSPASFIDEETLIAMMEIRARETIGLARLGYPELLKPEDSLRNYWLSPPLSHNPSSR